MSYAENIDSQAVKGDFKRASVIDNSGTWQLQEVMQSAMELTGVTDLASAKSAAETYLTSNDYVQITYWIDHSSTDSRSLWFLPA